jgi:hypothetical protein
MNLFHTFAAHCIAILVNFKTESHHRELFAQRNLSQESFWSQLNAHDGALFCSTLSEFENFLLRERILINLTTCQNETSS